MATSAISRGRNPLVATANRPGKSESQDRSRSVDKSSSKAKDLSHVPCKFHKQGSCTAGAACIFSHDLTTPGITKPICQWYAKGNCKFGHKCALAHIMPGQPLSWDRKNKRAAQAALRELNPSSAGIDNLDATDSINLRPDSTVDSNGTLAPPSGIGRSLSLIERERVAANIELGDEGWNVVTMPLQGGREQILASASSMLTRSAAPIPNYLSTSPQFASTLLPSTSTIYDAGQSPSLAPIGTPPSRSHGFYANGPPVTIHDAYNGRPLSATYTTSPPLGGLSGLSQTMAQQQLHQQSMSMSPRSSVAAQVMLSEQSRRYSNSINSSVYNNSDRRSSSPSRIQQLKPMRKSFGGEVALSTTSPLAMPNSAGHGNGGFATSPFSGSRALYLPSSYESNEGFLGSPTVMRRGLEDVRSMARSPWAIEGVDEAIDDEDDEYEERFLPSSLNDLLTPEEQFRRSNRLAGDHNHDGGGGGAFDPFSNSRSMPAPGFYLPSRISSTPVLSIQLPQYQQSPPTVSRSLLSVSHSFHAPHTASQSLPPVVSSTTTEDLLPSVPTSNRNTNAAPGFYSASFDPASAFLSNRSSQLDPLPTHVPLPLPSSQFLPYPSSLPKGLAAGLSSLHLLPAEHTGSTPPSLGYQDQGIAASLGTGSPLSVTTFISHEQLSSSAGGEALLPWNRPAAPAELMTRAKSTRIAGGMNAYASGNSGGTREEESFMFEMEE